MAWFNLGKKKAPTCCCNSSQEGCCKPAENISSIKVLGAGCKTCHQQYENVKTAVSKLGLSVPVEYITNMEQVMAYGIMSMPAIVVNEAVVAYGKLLKPDEVEKLLKK